MPICIKCKKEKELDQFDKFDDKLVCHSCLYHNSKPFKIYPIGFVENQLEKGEGFGLKGNKNDLSKIVLFETQRPFLYKLGDEEWITVVFYLHKPREIRSTFPRGIDGKEVGIFASRTPNRLSHIGITNVKLVRIEDNILFVENLDAINGTPILDIKLGSKSRW